MGRLEPLGVTIKTAREWNRKQILIEKDGEQEDL